MNWYRFKVELSAVGSGTVLLTLTTLVLVTASMDMTGAFLEFPLWMRPVASNMELVVAAFGASIGMLWLCHWQIFRYYRSRKAYGER
jgi:uncharacterized membrane protein